MSEDADQLTLEEALACLKQQFTEPEGLVAQIERGLDIDEVQVQFIEVALRRLRTAWEEKDFVPKQDVRLLWNVGNGLPRLEKCLLLYPQRAVEISNFLMNVTEWIEAVFFRPRLSEEAAITLYCQHIFGPPPFCVDLRFGKINEDAVIDLFTALDTLAHVWKNKADISKLAAQAIVTTPTLLMSVSDLFSGPEKQRLGVIEQELTEQILKCLS